MRNKGTESHPASWDLPASEAGFQKENLPAVRQSLPLKHLQPIRFGPEFCRKPAEASGREWIITNGIGGYASSTVVGMNTRRYHGLLVAATEPPLGRVVLLSAVDEMVVVSSGRTELSTHRYGNVIHPEGYRFLAEFRLDPSPTFFYRVGDILLEKTVFLLPGENAVVIGYTLREGSSAIELAVRPLIAMRDFRWVSEENANFNTRIEEKEGELTLRPYPSLPPLVIHHTAELVEKSPCWYKNFEYVSEREGPNRVFEDLWSPGQLLYLMRVGESCAFVASTGRRGGVDLTFHQRRLQNTQAVLARTITPPQGPLSARLAWTADNFLVHLPRTGSHEKRPPVRLKRSRPSHAPLDAFLLAGFPWATVWGRDALVALPGLTLSTGRFDAARDLLETFISKIKWGLLPVRLAEEDGSPEYDSADTSLWFFWAVWHYWNATKDLRFITRKLLGPMQDIMESYLEGTAYGIGMDEDGLIQLSDEELPMTWMDAREPNLRGDAPGKAVTPRFGKPIEINALWYCALNIMAEIGQRAGLRRAGTCIQMARLVEKSFTRAFIGPGGIVYDRVTKTGKDASLRPNMLIAASLPFSPFSRDSLSWVLEMTERELLTPFGPRTLTPRHPEYRGYFAGEVKTRAQAYHQGTVWPWLMGPYVSAVIKARRLTPATQKRIRKQLEPFLTHLQEGALGSVSELFDGDPPHVPQGAVSQAWSVGEILRAIREAKLVDL